MCLCVYAHTVTSLCVSLSEGIHKPVVRMIPLGLTYREVEGQAQEADWLGTAAFWLALPVLEVSNILPKVHGFTNPVKLARLLVPSMISLSLGGPKAQLEG